MSDLSFDARVDWYMAHEGLDRPDAEAKATADLLLPHRPLTQRLEHYACRDPETDWIQMVAEETGGRVVEA